MSVQLTLLKHKLRVQYREYLKCDIDCGNTLAKHVSGRFAQLCREMNETLDKLAKIDPATPTRRF